jgi:hypothetical protein
MKTKCLVTAAAVILLTGCGKLTKENYDRLKMGQEYGEVERILGKPDSCSDALMIRNCLWGNEQRHISVSFVGDKVMLFTSRNIK